MRETCKRGGPGVGHPGMAYIQPCDLRRDGLQGGQFGVPEIPAHAGRGHMQKRRVRRKARNRQARLGQRRHRVRIRLRHVQRENAGRTLRLRQGHAGKKGADRRGRFLDLRHAHSERSAVFDPPPDDFGFAHVQGGGPVGGHGVLVVGRERDAAQDFALGRITGDENRPVPPAFLNAFGRIEPQGPAGLVGTMARNAPPVQHGLHQVRIHVRRIHIGDQPVGRAAGNP